jgi:hypothetical protein
MKLPKGANAAHIPLSDRIKEAAEILETEERVVSEILKSAGIDNDEKGSNLLGSSVVSVSDVESILAELRAPMFKQKAAALILKGDNPFNNSDNKYYPAALDGEVCKVSQPGERESLAQGIAQGLKEALPNMKTDFKQLKDKDLLELYILEKDYEVEQELHRRAKYQPFCVLSKDKKIDVEASLDLLKRARRMVNPTMVPVGDTIVPVYRITEINPEDNVIEICPFCGGILYKSYCDSCQSNFSGIGKDERAYVNLIATHPNFKVDSFSDKRAVLASAMAGIEDLKKTWPSVQKKFDDLKLTDSLPSMVKVRPLPSAVKPADPFNIK